MVNKDKELKEDKPQGQDDSIKSKVCLVNRCTKVVAGGRRFSFAAVVISGNYTNKVGWGFAKANLLSDAIKKAEKKSIEEMIVTPREKNTIPFLSEGFRDSVHVLLKPAKSGCGIVAGSIPALILSMGGYKDIVAKNIKGKNRVNQIRAVFDALIDVQEKVDIRNERIRKKGI